MRDSPGEGGEPKDTREKWTSWLDKGHGEGIGCFVKNVWKWRVFFCFLFFFFSEFEAGRKRRRMLLQGGLLLLNSLKLASDHPTTGPSFSTLHSDIFSVLFLLDLVFWQCLAWLTNPVLLIGFPYVRFMTVEPLDFLDESSLLPLPGTLQNYYNGLLRMRFSLSLPPIHPFTSLIHYVFIEPLPCAKHMAIIKP